ncbi:MAG: DUF4011 domain-containing protein [Thermoguttaceae bacterium]|nr:DUF4011 domain-containing protein [Thermoguttaceae bacterium]
MENSTEGTVPHSTDVPCQGDAVTDAVPPTETANLPPVSPPDYQLEVKVVPKIHYAMSYNGFPIISVLKILNNTSRELRHVDLIIDGQPALFQPYRCHIDAIQNDTTLVLKCPELCIDWQKLIAMTESVTGKLTVKLCSGESVLAEQSFDLEVLAFDEWPGGLILPELLAAFVTPNHPDVLKLAGGISRFMEEWTSSPSLDGYLSGNPDRVKQMFAAVYAVIQQSNIAYAVPPASFETLGQRVRLCDAIMQQRLGTCLDLAVLFASCLESIGLHPILVLTCEHCYAGVWLEDEMFPEPVQDDSAMLSKRTSEGIHTISLVECTLATAGKNTDFTTAEKFALQELSVPGNFEQLIDVRRARVCGIKPLPQKILTDHGWDVVHKERDASAVTKGPQSVLQVKLDSAALAKTPESKKDIWERRLLDLSLRNTLLNLRLTRKSIPILVTGAASLEDAMADGCEFQLFPKPDTIRDMPNDLGVMELKLDVGSVAEQLDLDMKAKRLRTAVSEKELEQSLLFLYRTAKTSLEENGANTLYLAIGFLRWYETDGSQRSRYAPIILLPVDLIRKSAVKGYVIRLRDEDPQINITLLEMLRLSFKIEVTGLDPLPRDKSGLDLVKIFTIIRTAIMNRKGWDIVDSAVLGVFSLSQFVMWNDLHNHLPQLGENRIVSSLIEGMLTWTPENFDDSINLEKETLCPLGADASQLKAVYAAAFDRTFVLHGPPGTGKSQTITNIIAFALARGKRVLFVAEKKAALEVVQRRLEKIGLIPYCLELHSNRSTKKDVLDQLETAMQTAKTFADRKFESERDRLDTQRQEIAHYVEILHRRQSCGKSLFELIALYEGIDDSFVLKAPREWSDWDSEAISKRGEALERFCALAQDIPHPKEHPLCAFRRTQYTQRLRFDVSEMLNEVSKSLADVRNDILVAQNCVLAASIDSFDELKQCAEFLATFVDLKNVPAEWLKLDDLDQFLDRVFAFVDVQRGEEQMEREIRSVWPPAFLEMNAVELSAEYKRFYLDWPQNDPRERLPKPWFTERNRENFDRLKQLAQLGIKLEADAAVLSCRWESNFFKLDAKSLLAQWKELCLGISRSPVQTLPEEWFTQPDPEAFLRSVDIACQCARLAREFADSLMLCWYKPFLNQDGKGLLEKVKQIRQTNFLFAFGLWRALLNELRPWSRPYLTKELAVSGIEELCNYQEHAERARHELLGKESALKRYVCADGYAWQRMRSDCGLALSLLAEIKGFAPLWSAREAFLSNLNQCVIGNRVDPAIVDQSLARLIEYQETEKEYQYRLSLNQLDLGTFCQGNVQDHYDWSQVQSCCETVLGDWDAFCSWADALPGRTAFARKLNSVLPPSRSRHVVETGLGNLRELQRLQGEEERMMSELAPFLTSFDTGGKYDRDRIASTVTVARRGNNALCQRLKAQGKQQADVNECLKKFAALEERPCWFDIGEHWTCFQGALRRLFDEAQVDTSLIVTAPDYPAQLARTLDQWSGALDELRSWIQCCLMMEELKTLGLDFLIKAWQDGLATTRIRPVFHKSLCRLLISKIFEECVELNQFTGDAFEKTIEHFRECEEKWTKLVTREILATVSARIPDFTKEAASGSEPGILRRAIRGRGRGTSIRRLFERTANLLARLCPCMLMSPISVAQYLSPELKPFDLIVFDEASQMPTCKAVGALARGAQAVIVGDPRQLPPTSFFSTNAIDEDNVEMEDLDSILDDCLALSLPETHLRWHYRSRHESLIAFSNNEYYDGGLLTFPSANDNVSRVSLVHVPGNYDRGHSRTNIGEAHAVVAEVRRRLSDPKLAQLSMGVVTFSSVQQNLIDDLLSDLFKREPDLETIASRGDEPLFVKNLENVQGDERDVVLFSVCYAPDEKGKLSYNFGPLNRDGGWRRLNVAVTRARCEMIVFSTLEPEQIDTTRTMAKGVAGLKAFLEYAKKGANSTIVFNTDQAAADDGLAASVCRRLNELGYQTRRNIGRSAFRVDIGIVHPNDPQRFLLGILLDGEHYRSGENVHDREIGRIDVLGSLGWTIHRIWSIDWWDNADYEVQTMHNVIRETLRIEESQNSQPNGASRGGDGNADATVPVALSDDTDSAIPVEAADFDASAEGPEVCEPVDTLEPTVAQSTTIPVIDASEESESEESESDEFESDESESDESESEESESDESESDESESDESESEESESDESESDESESDEFESDEFESDESESDESESEESESEESESEESESEESESDESESDESESDEFVSDEFVSDAFVSDEFVSDEFESDEFESDESESDEFESDECESDESESDESESDESE